MFFTKQVNQFIAVVQEGSFLKAAEKISITPSAMSKGISELECKIGRKLIYRTRHGLKITTEGKWLYRELLPHYNHAKIIACEIMKSIKNNEIVIQTDGLYIPNLKKNILSLLNDNLRISVNSSAMENSTPGTILDNGLADIYISTEHVTGKYTKNKINTISMMPELIGLVMHKDLKVNNVPATYIMENNLIIQTSSTCRHPSFIKLKKYIKAQNINISIMEVTDVTEVCYLINNRAGISFMANTMNDKNGGLDNSVFMEHPFNTPITLQRYIHFKANDFKKLINVCSILSGF